MARHKGATSSRRSPVKALFGKSATKRSQRKRAHRDTDARALWWKLAPQRHARRTPGFATAGTRFIRLMGHVFRP